MHFGELALYLGDLRVVVIGELGKALVLLFYQRLKVSLGALLVSPDGG